MATAGWSMSGTPQQQAANINQTSRGTTNVSGTQNQQTTQTQRGSQATSTFQQNISRTGNEVLDNLLLMLQDRPSISEAELNAQAPLPRQRGVRTGGGRSTSAFVTSKGPQPGGTLTYEWFDPLTGATINEQQAQQLMGERQARRDDLSAEAGVTRGGTATQRANQIARDQTVSNLIQGQVDYSKGAALNDAQALVDQFMRQFGEENVAAITRAAEGAGTSASSVRSLLLSDAQARAAEAAGALGVRTATEYGGISGNFANVLEGLTRSDPVVDALLGALNVAKGAVQSGSTVTSGQQTTTTQQQTRTEQSQSQIEEIIRRAAAPKPGLDFASFDSDDSSIERSVTY